MMRDKAPRLVFVYGTLLRGEPNHRLLCKAQFVGPARTRACFGLVSLGPFPAMTDHGKKSVVGEVYSVDQATLAALDRLEGHPHFYRRVPVRLDDGKVVETYILNDDRLTARSQIESGDWRQHNKGELSCESRS